MPERHLNATVEDYTSDENGETRRDAGKQPSSTKLMPHLFHKNHRDAASDSGYSSHTSNTMSSSSHSQPASNFRPPPPPATQHAAPDHNKPMINRGHSQRHQSRPSRSDSMPKPSLPCTDRYCDDPNCASKRNSERGYTLPLRPQSQQAPPPPQTTHFPVQDTAPYSHAPNQSYAQVPHGQPMPNYGQPPQPRPHASSTSRSRPTSYIQGQGVPISYQHGMPPQANYPAQYHGLQASPSTHSRSYLAHHPPASGDWSGMANPMASGSPHDSSGFYMPGHGIPIPSNGQPYRPGMPHAYSARQGVPTMSSHDSLTPSTERAQSSQPVISARRRSDMPGSFPKEPLSFGPASDTSSSSESSDSEEEERTRQARRLRRREEKLIETRKALEAKKLMPPPMVPREPGRRRPTLTHTRTAPAEPKRTQSRGPLERSRHSEPPNLSSEYLDQHAADKRHTRGYERSRQPSISHHQSSTRHRSASISQESRVVQQYVVEDGNGRKTFYDTREEAEAKARRLKQQQHMDEAEAYQATHRGNTHPPTLTAESVKRASTTNQREHRRPASHVSGSSRKSTTSSVRTGTESIQITRDGTTFSIPTNTTLQIRQTEEGETWVIGSGSPPREHSYYGGSSKSSGSRVGSRRNGSDHGGRRRDTKTEDDGYEPRL